ncbi:MAG: 1-(5-phosphoribosyl)-5-[Clostridia bacterium]|nr:1-(5-phosphoribosyl)-5-[(5-phosphoribosylamino)methylideneamino]imidazole-4-carboxamide isomerase [Clostridia bacterium]
MIILPAIDILNGQAVRLYQGDYSTAHKVAADPVETALKFQSDGAEYLHIVDLSGAKDGSASGMETVKSILSATDIKTEVGGGIRNMETVEAYLSLGVDRVILGTAALSDRAFLTEAVKRYGEHVTVGIDAKNGKVSVSGWLETSNTDYIEFARICEGIGVSNIIFTDISRDGSLKGPNVEMLKALSDAVNCDITASGGIKDINDIAELKKLSLYGAICGKSLYSGTLDLREAISLSRE